MIKFVINQIDPDGHSRANQYVVSVIALPPTDTTDRSRDGFVCPTERLVQNERLTMKVNEYHA